MNPSYQAPVHARDQAPECALEKHLPRIAAKLCTFWNSGEVEAFIASLLMDSRDGTRQGIPWEAAQELMFLTEISVAKRAIIAAEATGMPYRQVYQSMRDNVDAASQDPKLAWRDPALSADARSSASAPPAVRTLPQRRPPIKKKSLLQRLFG